MLKEFARSIFSIKQTRQEEQEPRQMRHPGIICHHSASFRYSAKGFQIIWDSHIVPLSSLFVLILPFNIICVHVLHLHKTHTYTHTNSYTYTHARISTVK